MRKNQYKKSILVVALLLTTLMNAQNICVKRMNRYSESPSIVTIYRCNSLVSVNKNFKYNISILVDSIYTSEKIYRLTCSFSQPVENPLFEVGLVSGQTLILFSNYFSTDGLYFEALLSKEELILFELNNVSGITVWHKELKIDHNPKISCQAYFKEFIANY